jgi:hypothetical protein
MKNHLLKNLKENFFNKKKNEKVEYKKNEERQKMGKMKEN